jgi:ABC-type transporter MlaC component
MIKLRIVSAGIAAFLAIAAPAAAKTCGAEDFVTSAGNAFFAAARSGSPQAFSNAAARYADLRSIALFALGTHRRELSKAQEGEYVALARGYMGRFLAGYSNKLKGSNIKVTSCNESGKALLVKASSSSGTSLAFRVSKGKGGYRVQDVSVSSFWLASQLRGKFGRVIKARGVDGLMDFLRDGSLH